MAIPSRPIGQDPVSQQLWNISKQMEQLIAQVGAVVKNTAPSTTTTTTTSVPVTTEATLIYQLTSEGSGYPRGFATGQISCSANTSDNLYITVYYSGTLQNGTAFFSNVELTTPIQIETGSAPEYWHYKLTSADNQTGSDVTFNGDPFSSMTINSVTAC